MKKRLVLSIVFLLVIMASSYSFAEFEIKTGVKGGVTLNWIMPGLDLDSSSFTRDLTASPFVTGTGGAFVEFSYLFSGSIFVFGVGLEIGLMYSGRGVNYDNGSKEEAHYLGFPIMLKMRGPFIEYLWIGIGIAYQVLLDYKTPLSIVPNNDIVEFIGGIGFHIPITNIIEIVGEFRGYVGITHYAPDESRTAGLDIMFGVAFKVY